MSGHNICFGWDLELWDLYNTGEFSVTIKILKFGTPQTIAIIVLKIEKFDVTLH